MSTTTITTSTSQTTDEYYSKVREAAKYVKENLGTSDIAVVLGSGLNDFTSQLTDAKELPYSSIPHMPKTTVFGHSGKLVLGDLDKKKVLLLAGRSHGYEGKEMHTLIFTTNVLSEIGVKIFVATNASGGAMKGMWPGCLMLIHDHINFWHRNPLSDTFDCDDESRRNPLMNKVYSERLQTLAEDTAKELELKLFKGVYGATGGHAFETPAEVQGFVSLGACCFGMSTIPETMIAHLNGLEVFAISLITNHAAGLSDEEITHQDVSKVGQEAAPQFTNFMKNFLNRIKIDNNNFNINNKSNSLYRGILPLPQPKPVTKTELKESVKFLENFFGSNLKLKKSIFFNFSKTQEKQKNQILNEISTNFKKIPFEKIPHFPQVTGLYSRGELQIDASKEISVITGVDLERFSTE